MSKVICRYLGDLRCEATHAETGRTILTDAPVESRGKGEHPAATDLVAMAAGNCILTMMGYIADHAGVDLRQVTLEVEKEIGGKPLHISRLHVTVRLPAGVTAEQRTRLEHYAHRCPVHNSLGGEIDKAITFVFADAGEPGTQSSQP